MCSRGRRLRRTPSATAGQNPSAFSEDAACVFRNRASIWYAHYRKALKGAVQCAAAILTILSPAVSILSSSNANKTETACRCYPRRRCLPHEQPATRVGMGLKVSMMIKGDCCVQRPQQTAIAHTWYKKFILSYASRFAILFGGFDMAAVAHQHTINVVLNFNEKISEQTWACARMRGYNRVRDAWLD